MQGVARWVERSNYAARLHRDRGQPLVHKLERDDVVGLLEGRPYVAAFLHEVVPDVVTQVVVDLGRPALHRLEWVDDGRKWLVVNPNQFGRVLSVVPVL